MINKNIGYIICESDVVVSNSKVVDETSNGRRVIAEGIIQTANEKNRNGRYYPSATLFPQLRAPRILELLEAGYLRSELNHPMDTSLARQSIIDMERCVSKFLKIWTEGDDIWARYKGTNNKFGDEFDLDLREGNKPAYSLRALGTINRSSSLAANVVENPRIITWDCVIYPSHPRAYTQRVIGIGESAGIEGETMPRLSSLCEETKTVITPYNNQQVFDFIKEESGNLKYIGELFDFVYNDIQLNESGSMVSLRDTNTGDILNIRLEKFVHEQLMDYASRYDDFY